MHALTKIRTLAVVAASALALVVVVAVVLDGLLAQIAVVACLAHALAATHCGEPALRIGLALLSRYV